MERMKREIAEGRLEIADWIADWRLQIADCRLIADLLFLRPIRNRCNLQ
jgi:hypothetical protein